MQIVKLVVSWVLFAVGGAGAAFMAYNVIIAGNFNLIGTTVLSAVAFTVLVMGVKGIKTSMKTEN